MTLSRKNLETFTAVVDTILPAVAAMVLPGPHRAPTLGWPIDCPTFSRPSPIPGIARTSSSFCRS